MKINKISIIIFLSTLIILFLNIRDNLNISQIVTTVLTGIAAYATYLTAQYTKFSSKYQKESVENSKEKDLSNQASKIYLHVLYRMPYVKLNYKCPNTNNYIFQPILIGNSSNEPIYKVLIFNSSNKLDFKSIKNLESYSNKRISRDPFTYIYLPILLPGIIYRPILFSGNGTCGRPEAIMSFTDSMGHKWVRDPQGNLILLNNNYDFGRLYRVNYADCLTMSGASGFKSHKTLKDFYNDKNFSKFKIL